MKIMSALSNLYLFLLLTKLHYPLARPVKAAQIVSKSAIGLLRPENI
jgi:hypothetical protein